MPKGPRKAPRGSEHSGIPGDAGCGDTERFLFFVGLAAALAFLLALLSPMLSGLLYTHDDLSALHIPVRHFYAQCLAEGESPQWWPNVWCGYWLGGEGEAGMFHPLHMLLYGSLSFTTAFNIELFLSYPVMLLGMYLFLRRWRLGRDASILGALLFALSGFNLLHLVHMQAIAVLAHLPWLLFAIDVSLGGRGRKAAAANLAVALLTGSQLLLGHPQAVWFSALVELLYVLFLLSRWRASKIFLLGASKVCGVLIGAAQLIPTYYAFTYSARSGGDYSSVGLSLHPANLLQFVAPYLFAGRVFTDEPSANTHEYGLYNGAVAFLLLVVLVTSLKGLSREERRLALAAIALTLGALLLSLGRYGFVYTLLSKLPLVSWFRAPCRYIALVHFGMAVAAALGFETIRGGLKRDGRLGRAALVALAFAAALSIIAVFSTGWPAASPHWWGFFAARGETNVQLLLFGPVAVTLSALIIIAASRGVRAALVGIILLAAADQAYYGLSYARTSPPASLETLAQSVRLPEYDSFFRIEAFPTTDNLPTLQGLKLVTGYVGLNPQKALDYTKETPLRLASTAYKIVKSDATDESGAPVGRAVLDPVPAPLPRVRLVTDCVKSDDASSRIETLNVSATAVVDRELVLEGDVPGRAVVTGDAPGRISVSTVAPSPQILVLSESYHPGWLAAVDGAPAEVMPVYGDFIGVVVDAGSHEVRLDFEHPSIRMGVITSIAGAGLAVIAFIAGFLGRRRRDASLPD